MITTAIIVLGIGSLVGGAVGWKLGRAYERVRDGGAKGKKAKDKGREGEQRK